MPSRYPFNTPAAKMVGWKDDDEEDTSNVVDKALSRYHSTLSALPQVQGSGLFGGALGTAARLVGDAIVRRKAKASAK